MASVMGTQTMTATVLSVRQQSIGGVAFTQVQLSVAADASTESGIGGGNPNAGGGTPDSTGGVGVLFLTLPVDESITSPVVGETFDIVFD